MAFLYAQITSEMYLFRKSWEEASYFSSSVLNLNCFETKIRDFFSFKISTMRPSIFDVTLFKDLAKGGNIKKLFIRH